MSIHDLPASVSAALARCINLTVAARAAQYACSNAFRAAEAAAKARCAAEGLDPVAWIRDATAGNLSKTSPRYLTYVDSDAGYTAGKLAEKTTHREQAEAVDHLYEVVIASPLGNVRPASPILTRQSLTRGWRYFATVDGGKPEVVRGKATSNYRAACAQLCLEINTAARTVRAYWGAYSFHCTDTLARKESLRRVRHGVDFHDVANYTDPKTYTRCTLVRAGGIAIPLQGE